MSFWKELKKPIAVQAPMDGYTDLPFREMLARYGPPDVYYTEFVSAEGLSSKGRKNLIKTLKYNHKERPIVAQLFGSDPKSFEVAGEFVASLNYDGLDINMGCPDRKVFANGSGSALIETPALAKQIISAAKKGANGLPISVKTRIGVRDNSIENWLPVLLEEAPDCIIIHARTKVQMYKGIADWDSIKRAVEIRNHLMSETLIIGNGDIHNYQEGIEKSKEAGTDGFMIGRAMIGNPWVFNNKINKDMLSEDEIFDAMITHARLYEETLPQGAKFYPMRKHLQEYLTGFQHSKKFRMALVTTDSSKNVENLIARYKEGSL